MIIVREATPVDIDQIMNIEKTCTLKGEQFSRRRMLYLISQAKGLGFVAELKDNSIPSKTSSFSVIGYMNILYRNTRYGVKSIRLYNIAVNEKYRGCGVGQALIDAFIVYAKKMGVNTLSLEVMETNNNAIRLYLKNGFRRVRILNGYYGNGLNGIRMVLNLN